MREGLGAECAPSLTVGLPPAVMPAKNSKLEFHPLTPERWRDFESLFGARRMRRMLVYVAAPLALAV